jgi:hypothetical protein
VIIFSCLIANIRSTVQNSSTLTNGKETNDFHVVNLHNMYRAGETKFHRDFTTVIDESM